MLSKLKKIFFMGMFGVLYVSFTAQLIYALIILIRGELDTGFIVLGLLSVQWLVLIAARYLSKKSATGGREGGYGNNYRR
ncbi:MAG: hypothetical protein FWG18_02730 [Alphaproteobacteria bacterium]|nr:hypothetical protein [Alphaproteobacteria bacterium]